MRMISLFSGAGGLDLGLKLAGHSIVWANDNDHDAVETYRKNIGGHIIEADIEAIPSDDIPNGDVVVGGFPCQGFSQANMHRSKGDSRNKLYLEFLRVVRDKRPRYFLAENVRGILSLDGGKAIAKITSDFSALGYRVCYRLFNVADYGVPQLRMRVIIAGTRGDLPPEAEYRFPAPTHSRPKIRESQLLIDSLPAWVSCSEALRDIPDPSQQGFQYPNHVNSKYKVTDRNFTGHRRTDPDKPSPTILARGNGHGGVCAIMHPRNHRRMTIRESATIQTFPLDFEFVGRLGSCYRQVGNAVPVLFAYQLGRELNVLEKKRNKCA